MKKCRWALKNIINYLKESSTYPRNHNFFMIDQWFNYIVMVCHGYIVELRLDISFPMQHLHKFYKIQHNWTQTSTVRYWSSLWRSSVADDRKKCCRVWTCKRRQWNSGLMSQDWRDVYWPPARHNWILQWTTWPFISLSG